MGPCNFHSYTRYQGRGECYLPIASTIYKHRVISGTGLGGLSLGHVYQDTKTKLDDALPTVPTRLVTRFDLVHPFQFRVGRSVSWGIPGAEWRPSNLILILKRTFIINTLIETSSSVYKAKGFLSFGFLTHTEHRMRRPGREWIYFLMRISVIRRPVLPKTLSSWTSLNVLDELRTPIQGWD